LEKCWLPKCNSMRTGPVWIEPEIYFRIVHLAGEDRHIAPVPTYRSTVNDNAPEDLRMNSFMVSFVYGWDPLVEGMQRLKGEN